MRIEIQKKIKKNPKTQHKKKKLLRAIFSSQRLFFSSFNPNVDKLDNILKKIKGRKKETAISFIHTYDEWHGNEATFSSFRSVLMGSHEFSLF